MSEPKKHEPTNPAEYNQFLFPARTPHATPALPTTDLPGNAGGAFQPETNQAFVPFGDTPLERYTRMHEAAHATWASGQAKRDALAQAIEDIFITLRLPGTGQSAFDSLASVELELQSLAKAVRSHNETQRTVAAIVSARSYAILGRLEPGNDADHVNERRVKALQKRLGALITEQHPRGTAILDSVIAAIASADYELARKRLTAFIHGALSDEKPRASASASASKPDSKGKGTDESERQESERHESKSASESEESEAPSAASESESAEASDSEASDASEGESESADDRSETSDATTEGATPAGYDDVIDARLKSEPLSTRVFSAPVNGYINECSYRLRASELRANVIPLTNAMPQNVFIKRVLGSLADSPKPDGQRLNAQKLYEAAVSPVPLDSDIRAFKRRSKGATILVDASGSMRISNVELAELLRAMPGCTIAVYNCSTWRSADGLIDGYITHVARAGMVISDVALLTPRNYNLIDLHAAQWLLREPGPRYFVTDLEFTGPCRAEACALVDCACERRQLKIVPGISTLLRMLGATKR